MIGNPIAVVIALPVALVVLSLHARMLRVHARAIVTRRVARMMPHSTCGALLIWIERYASYIACGMLILALGDLHIADAHDTTTIHHNVVIVVDQSPSMAARDLGRRSRFDTVRDGVGAFIAAHPQYAYSLIGFGSEAGVVSPLGQYHAHTVRQLDAMRVGDMGEGSALGLGLTQALTHTSNLPSSSYHILLFTDGNRIDDPVDPRAVMDSGTGNAYIIDAIAVGNERVSAFNYQGPDGRRVQAATSGAINRSLLRQIAGSGNGHYFEVRAARDVGVYFQRLAHRLRAIPPPSSAAADQRRSHPLETPSGAASRAPLSAAMSIAALIVVCISAAVRLLLHAPLMAASMRSHTGNSVVSQQPATPNTAMHTNRIP